MSPEEADAYSFGSFFGLHAVGCPFHRSRPCLLTDVEAGVARAWQGPNGNFSSGYVPLMDNNLMLWTETLGPTLDAFLRKGVEFYPMKWNASSPLSAVGGAEQGTPPSTMYSVLASPGGKVLVEIAARDPGGRDPALFHTMDHARAVLDDTSDGSGGSPRISNDPLEGTAEEAFRPLAPLRISSAVDASLLDATLAFYGVGGCSGSGENGTADGLGFSHSKILLDETSESNGDRAVTIMLAPNATVHLQLWARSEEPPLDGRDDAPVFPSDGDFLAAVDSNQVNGGQPEDAAAFCASGQWTVSRYNSYVLKTHEPVMTPVPSLNSSSSGSATGDDDDIYLHPPAGNSFDVFVDDHLSWDCTSPIECDLAAGGAALYQLGSRVQWLGSSESWAAYSYDPSGFGLQLHWFASLEGFEPSGVVQPYCFLAYSQNGTCDGSIATP